jgi:hypothetical protein
MMANFGINPRNGIALLQPRADDACRGRLCRRKIRVRLVFVRNVRCSRERDRGDRLTKQVALLAEPNTLDVLIGYRGHGHRLTAGFQEYDIAGLERHGLSFR